MLKKQEVRDEFMKGLDFAVGKNVSAFFKLQQAQPRNITPYDVKSNTALAAALTPVLQGKKDINTGLREAEEAINKIIETEQASKK